MIIAKKEFISDNKEWIVLIHGLGMGSQVWEFQKDIFKNKYNVLFIDLPNHGYNKKSIKDTSIYNIIQDINSVLVRNNIDRAYFMGLSLGTIIIQSFEQYYPNKIKKSILISPIKKANILGKYLLFLVFWILMLFPYKLIYELTLTTLLPFKKRQKVRIYLLTNIKKMKKREFYYWYKMRKKIFFYMDNFKFNSERNKLYILGDRDFLFLKLLMDSLRNKEYKGKIQIVKNSNHLCNLHSYQQTNKIIIEYLKNN